MQEICQKRLDLDLVQPTLDASARLGIATTASFITGYPEESAADQNDTLDMLGRCFRQGCLPQLHILAPEPGTPMFERGRSTIAYDGYGGPFNATLLDDDDLRAVLDEPEIFSTYYYYPAAMARERYVFAVETAQLLRRAGPILVQYLLRVYDGRLSLLVEDLRRFSARHRPGRAPDAGTLEAFIREAFGPTHHMTSLFRYALCITSRGSADVGGADTAWFDADVEYELNPDVAMLPDLHDCQVVLDRISNLEPGAGLLDDAEAGDRALCVIAFSNRGSASYRIDSAAEPIVRLFDRRRSCRDAMRLLSDALGDHIDARFLEDLARAGIIVPSHTPNATTGAGLAARL
jgi:hypothetical protein